MRDLVIYYLGSMGMIVTTIYFTVMFIKWIIRCKESEENVNQNEVYKKVSISNESILSIGALGGIPIAILMAIII